MAEYFYNKDVVYKSLDKYVLLVKRANVSQTWTRNILRVYILQHIARIKKDLGRYYLSTYSATSELTPFWLLYDLEALGKSKSAEKIYLRLIQLGVIRGV